jgi:hypothetical protein
METSTRATLRAYRGGMREKWICIFIGCVLEMNENRHGGRESHIAKDLHCVKHWIKQLVLKRISILVSGYAISN